MKLIKNLGTRPDKTGTMQSWAEFHCEECKNYVEKRIGNGLVAKSCGCQRHVLSAKSNTGKKRTEEQKQKISKTRINSGVAKGENNPFYGKKHTKEVKQKISISEMGKKVTEETRQKLSKALKGRKAWNKGIPRTEEVKQKMSTLFSGKNNPMYGKIGILSPNWCGGISFLPYPSEFNKQLKQFILERDNSKCQNPECKGSYNKLHIHHIDYDKKSNNINNLITLCNSCHSKTNGKNKRKYYMGLYQNIIIDRIKECLL